jgi:hypothetical protein
MNEKPRDRSLFGPIVLIGAGVIWLLVNYNVIQGFEWWQLLRLWPLFLIAAGLELLLGRNRPLVSALIGLLTVGAAVALLYFAPQLGLGQNADVQHERFTETLEGAELAEINLDLSSYPTAVQALEGSTELVDAELDYTGEIVFETSGTSNRTVNLRHAGSFSGPWDWFEGIDARWHIGLSPAVPLALNVDVGSGTVDLTLTGLQLTSLGIDGGSGALQLALPTADSDSAYRVDLKGGSGANGVTVAGETHATLEYNGGSGSLTVDVPDGLGVKVEVLDSGSGAVRLPGGWETVRDGDDDEGVWQTAGFAAASHQFVLVLNDVGSGSITVR